MGVSSIAKGLAALLLRRTLERGGKIGIAYLGDAACTDCGFSYSDFGLDITLSDDQWAMICPDSMDILLCASCIAKRAARLPGSIAIRATIEMAGGYIVGES